MRKVRRTRGANARKRKRITVRINGKGFLTFEAAMNEQLSCCDSCAASDDAGGTTDARAANSPAVSSARPACAEVAGNRNRARTVPRAPSEKMELPPGEGELPTDSGAFVDAVFARVDLVEAWARQVRSEDEKVAQRALESLHEMKYERERASDGGKNPEYEIVVPERVARAKE